MRAGNVFRKNYEAYQRGDRLIVNQGGTSSGKTYSILQLLFYLAELSEKPVVISIVSQSLPHLKLGAIRDFKNILEDCGIIPDDVWMKTDNIFSINKSVIEFWSTDNLGKVHGPRRDILFLNECNNISFDIFTQLEIRTRQSIFLDFNPVREFWYHENILDKVKHTLIRSTYLDNLAFLEDAIINSIESKKHVTNWWRIYGLGELGVYEGIVFHNWTYGEFVPSSYMCFGLDFGFHPDPDTLIKVSLNKREKKIYVKEFMYNTGNSTAELIRKVKLLVPGRELIIADSAEPRLINDIRLHGVNIQKAIKKMIAVDIKTMEEYQIVVDRDSPNVVKELNNYLWNDKKAGIPIDAFNHTLDALRYCFNRLERPPQIGLSV